MSKKLLETLQGKKSSSPPFWFMRQAGRYLSEYREMRSKAKNFLDFCYTPAMASEATLQPIRRFGMDGAIIFSDILVIPDALGVDVRFEQGHGPVLVPVQNEHDLDRLGDDAMATHLAPVYEALRLTRAALPDETTLIGFAGAPWTLACYMVEGKASRDFQATRLLSHSDRKFFSRLIDMLTQAVAKHAIAQIEAGAEVIQIFDSWAGVLSEAQFRDWSVAPMQRIVSSIKARYPNVPVIGFPRQAGTKYLDYAKHTGVDAVSIDASVSLAWAKKELQPHCIVQGNLDPVALAEDKAAMLAQASEILSMLADKAFVFNLGHGILPHTPVENVQALCDLIRKNAA